VEEHGRAPKHSEDHGKFWTNITQRGSSIYDSILSIHPILKTDYERIQERKLEKKEKKQSPQERGEQLIAWVEEHGRVPKQSEEHGLFWNNIKQGLNKALYALLLCTHPILRADYDNTQQKRIVKQSP
jgi:hypothetical protein